MRAAKLPAWATATDAAGTELGRSKREMGRIRNKRHRDKKRGGRPARPYVRRESRACFWCGSAFKPQRDASQFCSKSCSARGRRPGAATDVGVRFWSKVKTGDPKDCWPWQASVFGFGYGAFRYGARTLRAHRVAWILARGGSIPDGLSVLHRCDNPPCCNPLHLKLGTQMDNTEDRMRRGRSRNQFGPWASRMYA